jgi:hypothetical protein
MPHTPCTGRAARRFACVCESSDCLPGRTMPHTPCKGRAARRCACAGESAECLPGRTMPHTLCTGRAARHCACAGDSADGLPGQTMPHTPCKGRAARRCACACESAELMVTQKRPHILHRDATSACLMTVSAPFRLLLCYDALALSRHTSRTDVIKSTTFKRVQSWAYDRDPFASYVDGSNDLNTTLN